ncbi:GDP-mannose 4,6-dehydratase (plasmid) [Sulfitobacter sp. TCYB15]|uniref:GDP-mannose 4,6-dehydratase n=1 Tax=Sulfitobacter sp. TCYB15 TaxID=3229275 RepID=A0AAU8C8N2_9RHOB
MPGYSDTVAMLQDMVALTTAAKEFQSQMIVHLAVQAGVRYFLEHPRAYVETNLIGTFDVIVLARIHLCTTC